MGRFRIGVGIAAAAAASLAAAAFAVEAGRLQAEWALERLLGVPVTVRGVDLAPGRVTLRGVALGEGAGTAPGPVVQRLELEGASSGFLLPWAPKRSLRSAGVTGLAFPFAGLPLQVHGRLLLNPGEGEETWVQGRFAFRHPLVSGQIEFFGPAERLDLAGWFETPERRRHFTGALAVSDGVVRLIRLRIDGGLRMTGRMVPAQGKATLRLVREGLKPQTLRARWERSAEAVRVWISFLDGRLNLSGDIGWEPPHSVRWDLALHRVPLGAVFRWFLDGIEDDPISGRLSGRVLLSGPLARLESSGRLNVRDLGFAGIRYPKGLFRFEGAGPVLRLRDCRLNLSGRMMSAEGVVDLRKLGRPDFFSQIEMTPVAVARFDGWRPAPAHGWGLPPTGGKRAVVE